MGSSVRRKIATGAAAVLLALIVCFLVLLALYLARTSGPVRIGVLIPSTGPYAKGDVRTIQWAADVINGGGGIGGRKIELVVKDTGSARTGAELEKLAAPLLADSSVKIVIGPWNSEGMFKLAPRFIQYKKLLISPTSTADEIYRAFSGKHYPW
ncbi:MAG: ABC transporter substrate-binding protein, partial [Candidatus Geothermincolia bacterium]